MSKGNTQTVGRSTESRLARPRHGSGARSGIGGGYDARALMHRRCRVADSSRSMGTGFLRNSRAFGALLSIAVDALTTTMGMSAQSGDASKRRASSQPVMRGI